MVSYNFLLYFMANTHLQNGTRGRRGAMKKHRGVSNDMLALRCWTGVASPTGINLYIFLS
jgi:hypothetical protein